jgi:CRP-like cAMP-binding protein
MKPSKPAASTLCTGLRIPRWVGYDYGGAFEELSKEKHTTCYRGRAAPELAIEALDDIVRIGGCLTKRMSASSNWPRNRLLLALPPSDIEQLLPELEQIRCQRELVLMDADSSLDHVFFPDSGVVSAVAVYADGSIIEMATIGREGCTAVQAVLGAERSSIRLLVQLPGSAAKMPRAAFAQAMMSMPSFRGLMFAYVQAFLEQVLVSVACNGAHSLKQRLARWLLTMRDRSDGDALQITQNLLAEMLGVQRPTVTNAARELERAGLIVRGRRQVTLLDRRGLSAEACECYQLVRSRIASHLPKTYE